MRLYNTMSRKVEELQIADPPVVIDGLPRKIRMYACGPTVYAPAHIGNLRAFVVQDTLRRVLEVEYGAGSFYHVRNLTDVDDKTIRDSIAADMPLDTFTQQWIDKFHKDCAALNMLPPHKEPRATEHIPQQIALVLSLIDKGFAYASEGSVYFRVASFDDYGKLSGLDTRELRTQMENSAGEANDADEYDRESVRDFVLWKAWKETDGPNKWPSPWGEGRPGWHLECSAMSYHSFKQADTFELHAGGVDLAFPHHENEIAQSCCGYGGQFARHWFHNAHLMVEGQKMSKSLGNLYTLDQLMEKGYSPAAIRYALLSGHYRQQLNFTFNGLDAADSAIEKIEKALEPFLQEAGVSTKALHELWTEGEVTQWGRFEAAWKALSEDLNTPGATGELFKGLKKVDHTNLRVELVAISRILYALGLKLEFTEPETAEAPAEVQVLAQKRWEAKQAKDWAAADALRDELKAHGWVAKDRKDGYNLEPA